MRKDIEFNAEGVTLRGWLYTPERAGAKVPAVVMAHGFSAVKEMYLDRFAECFAAAGLAALVFDNRNFGASDGEPRQEIDPWAQVRDYRHAITWIRAQPGIDRERIGVWGSSYSGGHALVVGAIDRRVRCVVSQVALISGYRNFQRFIRQDMMGELRAQFDADREARFNGAKPAMVPVVSADPLVPSALPTVDSAEWFLETGRTRAPAWRNEVTLRTIEMITEYEPGSYIAKISPTPLMMIVAKGDHVAAADQALEAFGEAREPKRLVILKGGHFDAYVRDFESASKPACDWFVEHLKG
ncbi:MAG TPA: alpha/beta hydrolase [Candidatus Binataceae bacterium]|nr:alpha/beta hydrolase [Candidatus Binataceae bacterium]